MSCAGSRATSCSAACSVGLAALAAGVPILTDTAMAAAAVAPMARRTFGNPVHCLLDWAPGQAPPGDTRSAAAVRAAWRELTALQALPAPADASPADLLPTDFLPTGVPPAGVPTADLSTAAPRFAPVVLIGSAPTALERLLDLVQRDPPGQPQPAGPGLAGGGMARGGMAAPSLLIGMPVGFVGVAESKRRLAASGLAHIRLEGSRGGAGLVAAACNALLRAAWLQAASAPFSATVPRWAP